MITHPEVSFQMVVRSLALCLALTTLPAIAQNNFSITIHGKPAGKASYTIDKTKDGFHVKSKVSYRLTPTSDDATAVPARGRSSGSAAPGAAKDFQFVGDYKLDADSSFAGGFINNMVTLVNTSYSLSKLATSSSSRRIKWAEPACRPSSTSSPTSSSCRTTTPASSNLCFCKRRPVPHQRTSTSPSCPAKSLERDAAPAVWLTNQPDAHGTLNGNPIPLHHFVLRLYKSEYDLFADETNTLMLATSTDLSAIYTRDGFVLISTK